MTGLVKEIKRSSSVSLRGGCWRGERLRSPEEEQARGSRRSSHAPSWKRPSGPEGQRRVSQGVVQPARTQPLGKHWSKQQHPVLVPEECGDRVAWRTLRRGPDAGSWTPKLRSAPTPRRTNDNCKGVGSGRNSSGSGRPVPRSPWEQEGSDTLPGGQGIAASPASSLGSVLAGSGDRDGL